MCRSHDLLRLMLCVEVDVASASALNVANSLLSCENNIAGNESKVQRFAINLDDDSDDDEYMISNSYVEDERKKRITLSGEGNTQRL